MQFIRSIAISAMVLFATACGGSGDSPADAATADVPTVASDAAPDTAELPEVQGDAVVAADAAVQDASDTFEPSTDTALGDVPDALAPTDAASDIAEADIAEDVTTPGPCPAATTCTAGYCIPNGEASQCVVESDCPGISSCNPGPVGGICLGCGSDADCPGTTECTTAGACAESCDSIEDCISGRCAITAGFCAQKVCTTANDCPSGATCDDGKCVRVTCPNPCAPNPCAGEHRTVCSVVGESYACSCNDGYRLDATSGACVPETAPGCDAGFACEAGLCVNKAEPFFQCAANADCGGALTCSPALPSGQCRGCVSANDCPAGYDTCTTGFCLRSCTSSTGCHSGMTCSSQGFCGKRDCASDAECGDGYRCDPDSSPRRCVRKTCP